jgi:predicted DNA-binding transcriptional regulator AlpA
MARVLIELSELIEATGYSRATIFRYLNAGMPRCQPAKGRALKFRLESVLAWLETRERQPAKKSAGKRGRPRSAPLKSTNALSVN